ncbi:MAG: Gfo/Idh/MocA family oxidoreductase [Steroidobacteraceae bacterium]
MRPIHWGVVGTGRMAAALTEAIASLPPQEARVIGVASRDRHKAASFASRHGILAREGLDELLAIAELDAVYIATPHTEHHRGMLAAIAARKAVLCEKPFTINAMQASEVIEAARAAGVFVMEAMWTRFLPSLIALRESLAAGTLGPLQMLVGGGAFLPDRQSGHYLLDPHRGGGALLDAGVYLVSLASLLLGPPSNIHATGIIGPTGVDEQHSVLLQYPTGAAACLYVSLQARRSPDLEILGRNGRARLEAPVFRPARITWWDADGRESVRDYPIAGSGYAAQVLAVNEALRAGRTCCEVMHPRESLEIMRTLDAIRAQLGLVYPCERT